MSQPTQREWDTMNDCLEAFKAHLEKHEPQATNTINTIDEALMVLGGDVNSAFEL